MLAVIFHLGEQRFALDAERVEMVVPALPLSPVPGAPPSVAGRFEYRGCVVPVINLAQHIEQRTMAAGLSSRYLLVPYPLPDGSETLLGLWAERVTETREIPDEALVDGGVSPPDSPYLGHVFRAEGGEIIQCVETGDLLEPGLRAMLFNRNKPATAS